MRALHRLVGAATIAVSAATPLQAQRPWFGPTLNWDSGLIDTPVAWVSPLTGDMTFHATSFKSEETGKGGARFRYYKLSTSLSFLGKFEVGQTAYTGRLSGGSFARWLAWDQQDGQFLTGAAKWAPSVAIGARNLGGARIDRWARVDRSLNTANTGYVVATRTLAIGDVDEVGMRTPMQVAVSAGYGTGLFKEDGGRGSAYAKHASGGVFGGAKIDFNLSRFTNLSLVGEWNAWDLNVGAVFEWSGLQIAIYQLEADAGSAKANAWTYAKPAVSVGWQTNVLALVRGNRMEEQVAKIERERTDLQKKIQVKQQTVETLNTQLKQVEGATEADRRAQRDLIEAKLKEEQEALKRLQELLKSRKPPTP